MIRRIEAAVAIFMSGSLLAGCALSPASTSAPRETLGRWEIVRTVSYFDIPPADLRGDLGPAYSPYLVNFAGFQNETFGISVGPDDDARYTLDGGGTWTKAPSAVHCRFGLDIVDEQTAWHCGNGGTRVTHDGGRTWVTVAPSSCPLMSFLNDRSGWTASQLALQATADGGASWQTVPLPPGAQNIAAITFRSTGEGFLLDTAGVLFATGDDGHTWIARALGFTGGNRLLSSTAGPMAVLRFFDDQHGLAVYDLPDRTVWFAETRDGGSTWQRAEIPELAGRSMYFHLFLSRDGKLLTATDDFEHGANFSVVLKYQPAR